MVKDCCLSSAELQAGCMMSDGGATRFVLRNSILDFILPVPGPPKRRNMYTLSLSVSEWTLVQNEKRNRPIGNHNPNLSHYAALKLTCNSETHMQNKTIRTPLTYAHLSAHATKHHLASALHRPFCLSISALALNILITSQDKNSHQS
ncbi:hypothetical protein VNO77_39495 [Canavalia gladiata]|uniref:Uncharacterized protein n=1 Tax=Canavalia gladiata TaxID=3824 RepID=A0AAN9KCP5_CANGL